MKVSAGKRYKQRHKIINSLFIGNPGLVLGFDLPFLIASSTSLKSAVAISIEMLFIHPVTMMIAVIFARKLTAWQRSIVTVIVSTGMMMLSRELVRMMFPDIVNSVGMYMYLMAVNGMTLYQSLSLDPRSRPVPVLRREMFHVLSFVITIFFLSVIREYLGNGTLWGVSLPVPFKLGGLLIPFSGFIMLGFLLAALKFFNHKLIGFSIAESVRHETRTVVIDSN